MIFDQKQQWRRLTGDAPFGVSIGLGKQARLPPLLLFLNYDENGFQIYYQENK